MMHDGMPYGRNQGQGQGHSREVDHQSPTGLKYLFYLVILHFSVFCLLVNCSGLVISMPTSGWKDSPK